MPFPQRLLNDNEDIILDLRPHWFTLARPVGAVVLALVLLGVLWSFFHAVGSLVGAAVTVVALIYFGLCYARWTTTSFVVTTDRLVYRVGVIAKRGKEIPLERVNDISFTQTIFERIIGAGDLSIESAGARSRETFDDIPRPSSVQNEIYRQMEAAASRHADRVAGRRELSVPEQLEKLDELRQRGVITQAEFDAKKAQLLERM